MFLAYATCSNTSVFPHGSGMRDRGLSAGIRSCDHLSESDASKWILSSINSVPSGDQADILSTKATSFFKVAVTGFPQWVSQRLRLDPE